MTIKGMPLLYALFLAGCAHTAVTSPATENTPTDQAALAAAYEVGVHKASLAGKNKIADDLIAITRDNDDLVWQDATLLVVTWKSQGSYDNNIKPHPATSTNEAYVVWVTTAPQVQQFCRNYWRAHPDAAEEEVELRLKQYLGLHYDWSYDVFVELWVRPDDLFRPCVDPEIDDHQCALSFDKDAASPSIEGIEDYTDFYKNLFFISYRYPPGVPWTGLGYTYDWGNPSSGEGASEFILRPSAPYTIAGTTPTVEYCRPDDK